jgi:hypothetical protein
LGTHRRRGSAAPAAAACGRLALRLLQRHSLLRSPSLLLLLLLLFLLLLLPFLLPFLLLCLLLQGAVHALSQQVRMLGGAHGVQGSVHKHQRGRRRILRQRRHECHGPADGAAAGPQRKGFGAVAQRRRSIHERVGQQGEACGAAAAAAAARLVVVGVVAGAGGRHGAAARGQAPGARRRRGGGRRRQHKGG